MDSTESFNVSVTENFSFWSLGSVYLNTGPAAAVCFAFLPTNPSRLFGSWSLCCTITSFTCSSCYAFLQESLLYLVLMSNEPIKLYFSLETAHSCFGKHWNVAVASSSWCTIATVTLLQEDVPWWAFAASSLENCSRTDSSIKQLPKYLGQGWESSCAWAGAVCGVKGCAGPSSPSKCEIFRFWAIGFLVLPGKTYFWSLFVEYFLQVNLEVLAVLRIMKPLTFLFQILTFKTKSIWSYPTTFRKGRTWKG